MVLDGASGEAACLCAGGEPPLVLRAGGAVEVVQICGPALGLFPGQGYAAAAVRLEPGDAVLLATDGLTEARRLAAERPRRLARRRVPGPGGAGTPGGTGPRPTQRTLAQVGRSVFEGARAFAGGAFHDDACLLIARKRPPRTRAA